MESILQWLYAKRPGLAGSLGPDDDLIESRIVDSLQFLELVYLLEEATGRSIDLRAHSVDDFRTLRRIEECFFGSVGVIDQTYVT